MATMSPTPVTLPDGAILHLRHAAADDAAAVLAYRIRGAADSPYIATAPGEIRDTPADQAGWIEQFRLGQDDLLMVADPEGGGVAGLLSLRSPGRQKLSHTTDLGMSVDAPWRGRGLGRAMMRAAIEWARARPTLERITLGVIPENAGALHLYESLGFVVEGVQHRHFRQPDGRYHDHVLMALALRA